MRSNFSTHIGLEGLFIVIMLIFCSGAGWVLLSRSCRIAFCFRCRHGHFPILVPAHWTGRVGPSILGFQMAYCAIECEPTISWCVRSVGFRVNLVYHGVNMKMLLVIVGNENVLVILEAKLVQRVQSGINPLCARWTFAWRPCKFIVEDCIVAAWVQRFDAFHLRRSCVDTDKVVRHYDISTEKSLSSFRVAFHCEVIQQSLETTSRLPLARLDFGDHSESSSFLTTVRSVAVIPARIEFSSLRSVASCGRPVICMSRCFARQHKLLRRAIALSLTRQ